MMGKKSEETRIALSNSLLAIKHWSIPLGVLSISQNDQHTGTTRNHIQACIFCSLDSASVRGARLHPYVAATRLDSLFDDSFGDIG